ncbi:MAG: hypothetical protein WCL06_13695, partial [Bacteroidota bacterium]
MKICIRTILIFTALNILYSINTFSQRWQSLRKGLDYSVQSFYADSATNKLYIGGYFRIADDSIITTGIASWDGNNFAPVGCGFDWNCSNSTPSPGFYPGFPVSMVRFNNEIYAAGGFIKADNKPIKFLAKWDGSNWDSVRSNIQAAYSILVNNNELYVCGAFDDYTATVTKWDGSAWTNLPLVPHYDGTVLAMAYYKGELYIGGQWDSAGYSMNIARFDGVNWHSLGNGIVGGFSFVQKMIVYHGDLFVAGAFFKSDGNPGNNIARWDGNNWHDLGGGVTGIGIGSAQIHDLIIFHDNLYACGVFSFAGGIPAKYIAKWDGNEWCSLGSYFDNRILGLGIFQDMLYIGGAFWTIDGDSINSIAKWTGGSYVDTCGNMTGIEPNELQEELIAIYPNPATNTLS